jgi:DNA-binding transcriptional LysR family regulator
MDWDKLRIFHAVAEAGSFTHAGEKLNLSQSAVSRQISALEGSLKVPLFHRHARGLVLTEQGDVLYRTAHEVFGKLAMTEAMLTESKERPRGELRINTTVAFGSTWLAPRLKEFLDTYPEIEVHLILSDRSLDLTVREADVAIRLTPPTQAELTPEELDDHRVIVYGHDTSPPVPDVNWLLRIGRKSNDLRAPSLTVNNVYAIMRAIQSGTGLGALPEFMAQSDNELVRVLPEVDGPRIDAFFVYPEELRSSKRIAVFRDFLLRKVAESRF